MGQWRSAERNRHCCCCAERAMLSTTTMSGPDPIPDVRVGNRWVVVVLLFERVGVGDVKLHGVAAWGDGAARGALVTGRGGEEEERGALAVNG